jgi:CheY-like chemotaxis protein
MKPRVLIFEDEIDQRDVLTGFAGDNYEVLADDGKLDLEDAYRLVETFKPHIIILDLFLEQKKGTDILRYFREKGVKYAYTTIFTGAGNADDVSEARSLGVNEIFCKPITKQEFLNILLKGRKWVADTKKEAYLSKLLDYEGYLAPMKDFIEDNYGVKNGYGAQNFYANFERNDGERQIAFKEINLFALKLKHTHVKKGMCLPVSCGCEVRCPICCAANLTEYQGHFTTEEFLKFIALILENSSFYNRELDFWLHDEPFFIAVMGTGEISMNFNQIMAALEHCQYVFGDRLTVNISTVFSKTFDLLKVHLENGGRVVPNVQISLYAPDVTTRKLHVNSSEDPGLFVSKGLAWAKDSNTLLTVNTGLTNRNANKKTINGILDMMDPYLSRIKFSLLKMEHQNLLSAEPKYFKKAARIAEKRGFKYEVFDEKIQAGFNAGSGCGNVANEIPKLDTRVAGAITV